MKLPMPSALTLYAAASALAAGLMFGAAGGAKWAESRRLQCEHARALDAAAAAQQQTQRLASALTAADASVNAALQQRDAADARAKEIARELTRQKLLSGRACLSGAAVGLLNSHPAVGLHLSAPAASPASAPAEPAAHPGEPGRAQPAANAEGAARAETRPAEASDADLAAWALDTMTLYQTCRARIDALRQWDAALNSPMPRP
ncbi:MAG: hypothetical protein AB1412_05330 [Pseudomonadota bacterium]